MHATHPPIRMTTHMELGGHGPHGMEPTGSVSRPALQVVSTDPQQPIQHVKGAKSCQSYNGHGHAPPSRPTARCLGGYPPHGMEPTRSVSRPAVLVVSTDPQQPIPHVKGAKNRQSYDGHATHPPPRPYQDRPRRGLGGHSPHGMVSTGSRSRFSPSGCAHTISATHA